MNGSSPTARWRRCIGFTPRLEALIACRLTGGQIQLADPADQLLCAGAWRVSTCGPDRATVEFTITPPMVQAA
jgi:hypothetical protein